MDKKDEIYIRKSIGFILATLTVESIIFFVFIGYENVKDLISLLPIFWMVVSVIILVVCLTLWLTTKRPTLSGAAFILSVLFWAIFAVTFKRCDGAIKPLQLNNKISPLSLESIQKDKKNIEETLKRKHIAYTWSPENSFYKIYREDSTTYYISVGKGLYIFEKVSKLGLKDTSTWFRSLVTILPLLSTEELLRLQKSINDKSFCLNLIYEGYSAAYPCWRTVVSQRYDTLNCELRTFIPTE